MKSNLFAVLLVIGQPLLLVPAVAHHGNASHFDVNREVEILGTITRFAFVNPHSYVYFSVESDEGVSEEWSCETNAATGLRRAGWAQETLPVGAKIRIVGSPARRAERLCYIRELYVNGIEFKLNEAPPIAEVAPELKPIEDAVSAERPRYLENGQPNISGNWYNAYFGPNRLAPYRPLGGYKPTEAGKAATENFDDRYESPALFCQIHNIIRGWGQDAHVNEIRQTEEAVYIQYGYMDFLRTVHLDMAKHPEDLEPSVGGHSIGWWEGDTLVVDTVGFNAGVIFPREDVMHSDQMHTLERFRFNGERNELERESVVTDPLYFTEPRNDLEYQVISAEPYAPFGCEIHGDSNHQRPEG